MKRKTKIITSILAVGGIAFIGIIVVPIVSIRLEIKDTYHRVVSADFAAVLDACREMMRTMGPNGETEIELSESMEPDLRVPETLRDMKPSRITVNGTNSVLVVFMGGFNHLGYMAYPDGVEGGGTRKLIDGLWLITDMEGPPNRPQED
ncbi:MAG: hypothetical protein JXR23_02445 [Pontiellaceae bacterium]|nr:hypothetical protein [Pontiellaceae bacterium]